MSRHDNRQLLVWQLVVVLGFISLAMPVVIFTPMLMTATMGGFFSGHNYLLLCLILALYPFGEFLSTVFVGELSDNFGPRIINIICLSVSAILAVLTGLVTLRKAYLWLLLLRFCAGAFEGNSVIAYAAVTKLNLRKDNSERFGRINAALTTGYLLGPILGGILSNHEFSSLFSYSLPFYVAAIANCIAVIFCYAYLDNRKIKSNLNNINQFLQRPFQFMKTLEPETIRLMMCYIILALGVDTIYQFLPIFLAKLVNYDVLKVALIISLIAFWKIIGNYKFIHMINKMTDRLSSVWLASLTAALIILIIALLQNVSFTYGAASILGICIAIMFTNLLSLISESSDQNNQGLLLGMVMCLRIFGALILYVLYAISSFLSYNPILFPMICAFVCVFFGWFMVNRQRSIVIE